jgi:hypothetical protein
MLWLWREVDTAAESKSAGGALDLGDTMPNWALKLHPKSNPDIKTSRRRLAQPSTLALMN